MEYPKLKRCIHKSFCQLLKTSLSVQTRFCDQNPQEGIYFTISVIARNGIRFRISTVKITSKNERPLSSSMLREKLTYRCLKRESDNILKICAKRSNGCVKNARNQLDCTSRLGLSLLTKTFRKRDKFVSG